MGKHLDVIVRKKKNRPGKPRRKWEELNRDNRLRLKRMKEDE